MHFPTSYPYPVEQQQCQEAAHSAIAIIEGVVLHILEMPAVGEAGGPHQVAVQPQDIVKRVQKVPSPRSEAKGRLSRRGPRRRAKNGCRPSQPPTFSNAHRVGSSESSRRRHTSPTYGEAGKSGKFTHQKWILTNQGALGSTLLRSSYFS